jgi:uncharacterized protein (TIGR02996 family)
MSDHDALLQGVLDAPADDAPRLVYADWLDDHGQAERADLIRLQIDLARTPRADPRRQEWQRREKEILDRHAYEWAAPLGASVTQWAFRRGFIERVEAYLQHPAEATRAILRSNPIEYIREVGLGYYSGGDNVYELDNLLAVLPELRRLEGLELWGIYSILDGQVGELLASPHLANLRTLILSMHTESWQAIDDGVLVEGLSSPHRANLRYLGVNFSDLSIGPSEQVIRGMAASPHLSRVRKLKLPNARLSADLLAGLFRSMPRLDRLDLWRCRAPQEAWNLLLARARDGRLRWLCLGGATVADSERGRGVLLSRMTDYRRWLREAGVRVSWSPYLRGPHNGGSWKGYSWARREQQHLFAMNPFIQAGDYDGLEAAYREDCSKYAGEEAARAVAALPFERSEESLHAGLRWAVAQAEPHGARAIFLRTTPGREWPGEFHLDPDDPGESTPRTDFRPAEPLARLEGPTFPEAWELFLRRPRTGVLDPNSFEHYLWARTAAAFGRCVRQYRPPVPVFFSCFYAAFRMPKG